MGTHPKKANQNGNTVCLRITQAKTSWDTLVHHLPTKRLTTVPTRVRVGSRRRFRCRLNNQELSTDTSTSLLARNTFSNGDLHSEFLSESLPHQSMGGQGAYTLGPLREATLQLE